MVCVMLWHSWILHILVGAEGNKNVSYLRHISWPYQALSIKGRDGYMHVCALTISSSFGFLYIAFTISVWTS